MGSPDRDVEVDISSLVKKIDTRFVITVILLLLLCWGFYLRLYHISYPIIGYHNWKTTHYITEARNFAREGFFKHGLFVPMRDSMENVNEPPDGVHNDSFPMISIAVAVMFRLFGETLVVARLTNIFFSLGAVFFFYLLIKKLFKHEALALLCALLASINPLYVFFSHNVQVVNPGLFFMLLGSYLYVLWLENIKKFSLLYGAALSIALSAMTKYSFAVIIFPILFSFPYKKVFTNRKKFIKPSLISLGIGALFPLWIMYQEFYVRTQVYGRELSSSAVKAVGLSSLVDFSILFDASFWQIMRSFIADNFTLFGFWLSVLGALVFLVLFFLKNKQLAQHQFMFGYLIGSLVFLVVMGYKLSGHNYHQFPIAPLVLFCMAFLLHVISHSLSTMIKDKAAQKIVYFGLVFAILIIPFTGASYFTLVGQSSDRMFNTQFPGLDVAGNYIREHSSPDERLFHSSGQSFGILWHADRKGYKPPNNSTFFEIGEQQHNVQWVFVYQWAFKSYCLLIPQEQCNPDEQLRGEYLRNHYRPVQLALDTRSGQPTPLFILLRKGGTFDQNQLNSMVEGKQAIQQNYQVTQGQYNIIYFNLE